MLETVAAVRIVCQGKLHIMSPEKPVDKLFVAAKAFIIYKGKLLLLRESTRYSDGARAGQYDVPGGRVKQGERFDDGLLREIKEETGLSVRLGQPIAVSEWRPEVRGEQWQVVATFFLCEASTDKVALSVDHDGYLWIDPADYKKYNTIPTNWPAHEAYLNLIQQHDRVSVGAT